MRLLQHHLREPYSVYPSKVKSHLPIAIEDSVLLVITNASASLAEVQQPAHPPHLCVALQIHPVCCVCFKVYFFFPDPLKIHASLLVLWML